MIAKTVFYIQLHEHGPPLKCHFLQSLELLMICRISTEIVIKHRNHVAEITVKITKTLHKKHTVN